MNRAVCSGKFQIKGVDFKVLSDDEITDIHYASLEILEKTGVYVEDDDAFDLFHSIGCRVDIDKRVVKIPHYLVEKAIRTAPSRIVLGARNHDKSYIMEGKRVTFTSFGEGVSVVDINTGEIRDSTKKDLAAGTRLMDALDAYGVCHRPVSSLDVDPVAYTLHNYEALVNNTDKPVSLGPGDGKCLEKIYQMSAIIAGGEDTLVDNPLICASTCPVTPLRLVKHCCEIGMKAAELSIPVRFTTMALSGATSPITLAGTQAVQNAEFLACVVMHQAVRPGAPVICSSSTTSMDLKSAEAAVGSPEMALFAAMNAQMAQFYKVPSWSGGTQTDSNIAGGAQAGHEKTLTALIAAMSGNNVLYGAGMLECGMVVDFAQLLLDSDIIDMIMYFLGGVEVSDETLCVDEIKEGGHKSDFLMSPVTLKYMRDQSRPKYFERMNRTTWINAGKPDPYDLANEKVKDILVNHQPTPLSDSMAADLRRFVAEVEKEWGLEPKNPDFNPANLV